MGTIISPVPAIDCIHWVRATGRAHKAVAVIVVPGPGKNELMIARLANGSFASSWDLSKAAYLPGSWPWTDAVIKALVKLEAITQADADAHLKACADYVQRRDVQHALEYLPDIAARAGVALTAGQKAAIAKATGAAS